MEVKSMRTWLRFSLCVLAALCLAPNEAGASCGSASCPIDTHAFNLPDPGRWSLDVSFQYIDQDEPRVGTHSAEVGEIPGEHDEVRTLNRATTLSLRYALSDRFLFGVSVPWVDRFHEHLEGGEPAEGHEEVAVKHAGPSHEPVREEWSIQGLGDVLLEGQARVWQSGRTSLWLLGGLELPTGASDLDNGDGEVAELPVQPGSDSVDGLFGATLRGSVLRETAHQGSMGGTVAVPYFAGVSYRRNGKGRNDYRLGDEWQLNAGGAYPVAQRLEALFQVNSRFRGKDSPGLTEEDPDFTGGTFVYLSPGLRLTLGDRWSGYLYVQVPVYQDVNQLQLTSKANGLVGVQARF
jgi:hypothetical protein